jgi:hypothetical protein
MRRTLSICVLAAFTLSGRPFAAADGTDASLASSVAMTSATLSISGTSTMHDYTVSTRALKVGSAIAAAADLEFPGFGGQSF